MEIAKNEIILQVIDKLKNSKTDDEFNENLRQYTLKLNEIAVEFDKQKELNKTLRNQNRLLSVELAQANIIIAQLKLDNDKLSMELHDLNQNKQENEKQLHQNNNEKNELETKGEKK